MNDHNLEHTSLLTYFKHMWTDLLSIIRDVNRLFVLEMKLAGRSIVVIAILLLLIIILLFSSWISLLGAIAFWLTNFHLSLIMALLLVSATNFILAIILGFFIYKQTRNLEFKETKIQLGLKGDKHGKSTYKD